MHWIALAALFILPMVYDFICPIFITKIYFFSQLLFQVLSQSDQKNGKIVENIRKLIATLKKIVEKIDMKGGAVDVTPVQLEGNCKLI